MTFYRERVANVEIVTLVGNSLDVTNSSEFKGDIQPVIEDNPFVILDMNNVKFVDSSGCGAILSCLRKAREAKGDVKICNTAEQIIELFRLIRLDRIIEIHTSQQKAVDSFSN